MATLTVQESCLQMQKEEILLLQSIYCGENECSVFLKEQQYSCKTAYDVMSQDEVTPSYKENVHISIKFQMQANHKHNVEVEMTLPKRYPILEPPNISIFCNHIPHWKVIEVTQNSRLYCRGRLPEPCLFDSLEQIKEELFKLELSDTPESSVQGSTSTARCPEPAAFTAESLNADHKEETTLLHLCVTKLNHMRSEQKYFKLLNSWAKELAITGKVLKVGDHRGIYAVLIGPEEALAVFLKKWKACKVDIDSHGRPCKEKLISVLCQQQIAIASHRRRMSTDGLVLVECSKLAEIHEEFSNEEVKALLKKYVST